jgi:hypothetical protein
VIWSGTDFQVENEFQWKEEYIVYGSDPFVKDAQVLAQTNTQPIQFGQTCELGPDRVLKPATGTATTTGPFYFKNSSDEEVAVGVSCVMNGSYSLILVTPVVLPVGGTESLDPVERVTVWFQQEVSAATMIDSISGPSIDVRYDGVTSHVVSYTGPTAGDATWAIAS